MSVRLSSSFYKATIDKFSQVADDPLAFPILLSFLEKASQSATLLNSAKSVIDDDDRFTTFYQKTRNDLPPMMAQIIQKQEEKIREKLRPVIQAEMQSDMRSHDLETELRVRKEYEATANKKEQERQQYERAVIGKMIQLQFETQQKIEKLTKQHQDFVTQSDRQAKNAKKHIYISYAVAAAGLAVSAIGWPSIWQKIAGQSSDPQPPLQVRLASSGLCAASDMKIEISKDGFSTLPPSGSVCLVTPEQSIEAKNDEAKPSFLTLPSDEACGPFAGKSWLDFLNDGYSVKIYKEDGSSICLHLPEFTQKKHGRFHTHGQNGHHSVKRPAGKRISGQNHKRCP